MRQVFNALPWIPPREYEAIEKIYYKHGRIHRFTKNSILKCGGECNKLFFLKKGLCCYLVNYNREKPRMMALLPPGRAMGDLTCMTGDIVNVTTYALRDSDVLTLPPDILEKYMQKDFSLAKAVLKTAVAKQECHLEGMIANFTLTPEERLKLFFKVMLAAAGKEEAEWNVMPLKLKIEEYGLIINATRVTVSRMISRWKEAGLIKKESGSIVVNKVLISDVYDWHNHII